MVAFDDETHSNGKTIRWCRSTSGEPEPRGIVCGAHNFAAGDLVVVALPGAVLAGGFAIAARKTYGHVSDGMICSARELGLGDDHTGIIVLGPDEGSPGDDAAALLHLHDVVLDMAVTPDRGYCLSMRGVAREVATAYGMPLRDPGLNGFGNGRHAKPDGSPGYPVKVDDPDRCAVYVARSITGLDLGARSPRWLQRRVQLAGMRPISLAVDVTNYVMLELGQPIHGFDRDVLSGPIVVRRAAAGEKLTTLDGAVRDLDPDDLLITDDSGPIGLAGVMGGESTEMGSSTRSIVIEAANFEATGIARTARRHKLPSEASKRFERGVDPALPVVAATRVADLLVAHGGATAESAITAVGEARESAAVEIDSDLPSRIVGVPYAVDEVAGLLAAVGGRVTPLESGRLSVVPPTWRPDLTDPFDLVEEVARLHGYDAIPSVLPVAPAGRGITFGQRVRRRIERAVAAAGYVEAPSYPFVGARDLDDLGLSADDPRRQVLRLANPLSDEEPFLRTTLLPGLLAALRRNVGRGAADVALFESGLVFRPGPDPLRVQPRLRVDRRPTDDELSFAAGLGAGPAQTAGDRRGRQPGAGRMVGAAAAGDLGRRGRGGPHRRRRRGRRANGAARRPPTVASRAMRGPLGRYDPGGACRRVASTCRAGARTTRPDRRPGARDRPARCGGPARAGTDDVHVSGGHAGRRPRRAVGRTGRRRGGGLARGGRRPARVVAAVRRLRGRSSRCRATVARVRAALPGTGPHAHRGRDDGRPRCCRRRSRESHRSRSAVVTESVRVLLSGAGLPLLAGPIESCCVHLPGFRGRCRWPHLGLGGHNGNGRVPGARQSVERPARPRPRQCCNLFSFAADRNRCSASSNARDSRRRTRCSCPRRYREPAPSKHPGLRRPRLCGPRE